MVRYIDLTPSLGDVIAKLARQGAAAQTKPSGTIVTHSADGTKTILGEGAGTAGVAQWVGDTTAPGVPTGLSVSSTAGLVTVAWDGTLDGGVPADFAYITVTATDDTTTAAQRLTAAGSLVFDQFTAGSSVTVSATASDAARLEDGTLSPNVSASVEVGNVTVVSSVSQAEVNQIQADLATNEATLTALHTELSDAQSTLATAQTDIATAQSAASSAATAAAYAQSFANTAYTAAANAQSTADGKNAVFRQASQPSTSGRKVGDVWFDTDDGNRIYVWSGSAWSPTLLGTAGIAAKAVTSGLLADGAVGSAQLAAGVTASITAAQAAADAAQSDADSAATAAADAAAQASAAQAIADDAADAAAAAAGVAAGKGDVLIQSAEPAAAMRKATTLWIDTTSGANTPKRWNGSSWVQVTDKAAVDAATAAANAQAAANSAAAAAANAQSTADTANAVAVAAQSAAEAAQSAATAAQTTADGKSRVVRSSSAPSTASGYSAGDQWWQYSSGTITGLWFHDGSAWVQQTLTNTVIANLDAGKITTGSLGADRIAAGSITASKLVSGTITAASGVIADSAIGTAQISNAAITSAKIQDAAITNAKIANIDAGKITTGTLDAGRIGANTITADKLLVGDFTNLWGNQRFDPTGPVIGDATEVVPPVGAGRLLQHRDHFTAESTAFPVTAADVFVIEYTAKSIGTGTDALRPGLCWDGGSGSWWAGLGLGSLVEDLGDGWGRYRRTLSQPQSWTTPAKTARLYFQIEQPNNGGSTKWVVADVTVRRQVGATLIQDGSVSTGKLVAGSVTAEKIAASAVVADKLAANSVTAAKVTSGAIGTDKLAANSVSADKIVSNAVTADKIAANAVTAVKLAAGAVTADKIDAGAVTAGKLSATAIDGKTITGATIIAEDSNGVETTRIDGQTGTLTAQNANIIGTLKTGAEGNRVEVTTDAYVDEEALPSNVGSVKFYSGKAGEVPATLTATTSTDDRDGSYYLVLKGGAPSQAVFENLSTKPALSVYAVGEGEHGVSSADISGDQVLILSQGTGEGDGVFLSSYAGVTLSGPSGYYRKFTPNGDYVWAGGAWVPTDTGWIPFTPIHGVAVSPTAYRRLNGVTYLRGRINILSGSVGEQIWEAPAGFRSSSTGNMSWIADNTIGGQRCWLYDGTLFHIEPSGSGFPWVDISGIFWTADA